jgi:AraC-like DNA-binding protein
VNTENTINTIFHCIGIPACVADVKDEVLISSRDMNENVYSHDFITECRRQYLTGDATGTLPVVLSIENNLLVGIIGLDAENIFILGPAKSSDYSNANSKYDIDFESLGTAHYLRFAGLMSLATELVTGREILPDEIIFISTSKASDIQASEAILLNNIFNNREAYDFHTPTSFETAAMDAIAAGDQAELKRRLSDPVQGKIGQMSGDILRQHKYLFVAIATMVSRAAIRGGMDEEIARSLFDTYCMQMDECDEIQDIIALAYKMTFDFCEKVSIHLGNTPYSPAVKKCVSYISRHLHDDIKLTDLALACRMSTRGISKKFRIETGIPISDFIHRKKMREACYLLKYSDYTISEIASILQYNTQSYFTKVFHDIYDNTPKQFRDSEHIS